MADPTTPTDPAEAGPAVVAKHAEFPQLDPRAATGAGATLDSLRDVPITVTARLGHTIMPIAEILTLGPGSVVELEEIISAPVELTVRGVPFAVGEVVVVNDHFAVRIKNLLPPRTGRTDL
ncbi:FliM/FliN family flagellar motor switch protein [Gemmata sp. G18]|uniref:Flagellar motor switch protein FliN n=1 Tax=Gemmata palustris TaxID=2822762 RepID=A0ABS5C706_9BACT|nr:FliM/FliN family flagellar motor switch protein [Gemmata palustris]MBP3960898.1 FliM/FliN family flagellar motor switch protein [Gemmata palustris]